MTEEAPSSMPVLAGQLPHVAGQANASPMWTPHRPGVNNRYFVIHHGMLHIVGVPLLILGSLGVGFLLVYLREVLVPFVISVLIVYLLRPLVNLLTTPFGRVFGICCPLHQHASGIVSSVRTRIARNSGYGRIGASAETIEETPPAAATTSAPTGRRRGPSPPKYHRTVRTAINKTVSSSLGCWNAVSTSGAGRSSAAREGIAHDDDCGCCCGPCRITRCPRWFAILIALLVAAAVLAGIVLLVADAIQRFKEDSLQVYISQAGKFAEELQQWLSLFGIHIEASAVLDAITAQISVVNVVQTTLTVIVEGVGNTILILLLVLYLLAEQNQHAPGSLRAKVDNQIQRYVVIKTAISAAQGLVVFFILEYILDVRMAHLFGVFHFIMNYIPTAGPIIATVVPMPIVVLDPNLGLTAKITAFAAPTIVHMVVGNFMEPLVFGSSMEIHPVTVLMALALFYAIWGIPGAILAVPITAVIRIILSAVDHPYAHIMINVLEGRLSAASQQFDSALDGSLEFNEFDVEGGTNNVHNASRSGRTSSAAPTPTQEDVTDHANADDTTDTPLRTTASGVGATQPTRRQVYSHGEVELVGGVGGASLSSTPNPTLDAPVPSAAVRT